MKKQYKTGQRLRVVSYGEPFEGTVQLSTIVDAGGNRYEKIWVKNDEGTEKAFACPDPSVPPDPAFAQYSTVITVIPKGPQMVQMTECDHQSTRCDECK
jgi:hypothetical protein